jgi:hypothetical protein
MAQGLISLMNIGLPCLILCFDLDGPVITQIVGWEKPDPIHEIVLTVGESTHYHLR